MRATNVEQEMWSGRSRPLTLPTAPVFPVNLRSAPHPNRHIPIKDSHRLPIRFPSIDKVSPTRFPTSNQMNDQGRDKSAADEAPPPTASPSRFVTIYIPYSIRKKERAARS